MNPPEKACRVLIAVPFYRNAQLVAPLFGALIACAPDLLEAGAEVVCFNDSPGHAPLAQALAGLLPQAAAAFPCRLVNNATNLGFVRTMNLAVAEAVARRADLLLLNSDTEMEAGALPEMLAVAALDPMIGFVNPRSNNATLATLPLRAPPGGPLRAPPGGPLRAPPGEPLRAPPGEPLRAPPGGPRETGARAAWRALSDQLPRLSWAPTAVGFCLLVRWKILAEFGGFDEIYGAGYNEENDLVMRAGRCGYRAVLANFAFVWHIGEQSFAAAPHGRATLEQRNRAVLDARYPEYAGHVLAHYRAPETLAEHLLAATLPDADGKRDIAFDFSSFRAAHNGTFEAGRQLLAVAARVWGDGFRLHVLCGEDVYAFHRYAALGIPHADVHGGRCFAAVFRVGQPYDWNVLERLAPTAAVLGVYMLDTISIDCPQLASPSLFDMWQLTLDHADVVAFQSRHTADMFRRRFKVRRDATAIVVPHALDLREYRLPGSSGGPAPGTGEVLVLGNHFHHKALNRTANALALALPERRIVAMGPDYHGARRAAGPLDPPPLADLPNLRVVEVGALAAADIGAAYAAADIVVFPSHAEGFGFPVLHALAADRPVLVRRLPVFEELRAALGDTPNLHFFETTDALIEFLRAPPAWVPHAPPVGNGGERAAGEIRDALLNALARIDYARIVDRVRAVQLPSHMAQQGTMPAASDTDAAKAARYLALNVERVALRLFRVRAVYGATRRVFRCVQRIK